MQREHVVFITDRSGSMLSLTKSAIDSWNERLQQWQDIAAQNPDYEVLISDWQFDHLVDARLFCQPVQQVKPLTDKDYVPRGSTALLDAIGQAVTKMESTYDPAVQTSYLFVIITDGEENFSTEYSWATIDDLLKQKQATNCWTFTFMVGDATVQKNLAARLSVPSGNYGVWDPTAAGMSTMTTTMSNSTASYVATRALGNTSSQNFYAEPDSVEK